MQKNQAIAVGIWVVAAALRLATPHEYEFKHDESEMVRLVQHARNTGDWPWLGMPTSQGFQNPGMSVWPFVGMSFVAGTSGYGLSQAVRILNVLAFALALIWALRQKRESQKLWLIGLLLAAVNPLDVVLQRKLWAQSILPIFGLATTWCWIHRKRHWGYAAGFGASAAVISQIHLSGVFFSFALGCAALWDRDRKKFASWAGALGALALGWPVFIWVPHIFRDYAPTHAWLSNVLSFRYFYGLLGNLSGTVLGYSLGKHFQEFLSNPWILGAHVGLIGLTAMAVVQGFRRKALPLPKLDSETKSLLVFGVLGTGVVMTLAGVYCERHYYLGLFPLPYVAFGMFLRTKKSHAPAYVFAALQLIISVAFLIFIHSNGGAPGADFGALPPR